MPSHRTATFLSLLVLVGSAAWNCARPTTGEYHSLGASVTPDASAGCVDGNTTENAVKIHYASLYLTLPATWTYEKSQTSDDVTLNPANRLASDYHYRITSFHPPLPFGFGVADLDTILTNIKSVYMAQHARLEVAEKRSVVGREAAFIRAVIVQNEPELQQIMYVQLDDKTVVGIGGDEPMSRVPRDQQVRDFSFLVCRISSAK